MLNTHYPRSHPVSLCRWVWLCTGGLTPRTRPPPPRPSPTWPTSRAAWPGSPSASSSSTTSSRNSGRGKLLQNVAGLDKTHFTAFQMDLVDSAVLLLCLCNGNICGQYYYVVRKYTTLKPLTILSICPKFHHQCLN